MRLSKEEVRALAKEHKVDLRKVNLVYLTKGVNIELEHGSKVSQMTNITKNDKHATFLIALAHVMEFPDYYQRLIKMEKEAEKDWKDKKKNILL